MKRTIVAVFVTVLLTSGCSGSEVATDARSGMDRYTVQPGDSLFSIAEQFDLYPVTILMTNFESLQDDPRKIQPGIELVIPSVDGALYEWDGEESWSAVADFYGVSREAILEWPGNGLPSWSSGEPLPTVAPGSVLFIPAGERPLLTPADVTPRTQ